MKRSSLWYLLGSVFNRRLLFFSAFGRRLKTEQPQAETKTQCAGAKISSLILFCRCPKEIPTAEQEKKRSKLRLTKDEPTWRCHQNPFIGALGIQEPVIPGEPLIKG